MEHENLFSKLDRIIKEIERLDKNNPTGPHEATDPRIVQLLDEGLKIQKELDPLIRHTHQNRKPLLDEWDNIVNMCDDPDKEESGNSGF